MSTEERMRELLKSAAVALEVDGGDPVAVVARHYRRRRARRRAVAVAAVATLVVAVVAGGAVLVLGRDDAGTRPAVTSPEVDEPDAGPVVTTPDLPAAADVPPLVELDPGPLSERTGPVVVSTGEEIVVWGGDRYDPATGDIGLPTDGAAYDPVTGDWRTMAPAPLAPRLFRATYGVWTGEEVVILVDSSVRAWDPRTDTWRALPDPPFDVADTLDQLGNVPHPFVAGEGMVWTGDEVILTDEWLALDPASGVWRELPDPPLDLFFVDATWTGEELIVTGNPLDGDQSFRGRQSQIEPMAYDPATDSWRVLATGPIHALNHAPSATWTGYELVVVDGDLHVAAYAPETDTWRSLPTVPGPPQSGGHILTSVRNAVVTFVLNGLVVYRGGEWVQIPADRTGWGPSAVAGDSLYVFGWDWDSAGNIFYAWPGM